MGGCYRQEDPISPMATLAVVTATPIPTPEPTPEPTPVPMIQECYSLYAEYGESSPLAVFPYKDGMIEILSQDPGHICAVYQGEVLSQITLETEMQTAYRSGQVGIICQDPVLLDVYPEDVQLMLSGKDPDLIRIDPQLSVSSSSIILPDGRIAEKHDSLNVVQATDTRNQTLEIFWDPGVYYNLYDLCGYVPQGNRMAANASDRVTDSYGILVASIDSKESLCFMPTQDLSLNVLQDDKDLYIWAVKNEAVHYYRLNETADALIRCMQFPIQDRYPDHRIADGKLYLAQKGDDNSYHFYVYDLTTRNCLAQASLDTSAWKSVQWAELIQGEHPQDFWIRLDTADGDIAALLQWNYTECASGDPAAEASAAPAVLETQKEMEYSQINGKIRELEEKFGVKILIGENARIFNPTYSYDSLQTDEQMLLALTELQEALSIYPDGFFREFTKDGFMRQFIIALAGDIQRKNNYDGIESVVGFANNIGDSQFICLDTHFNTAGTFHHEVTHAIDEMLKSAQDESGNTILDETAWAALNPEGFTYYESYLNDAGRAWEDLDNGKWTMYVEDRPQDRYFMDRYSKPFPEKTAPA